MLSLILLPFILITVNTKSRSSNFYVIPLGTSGGLEENNLSAYLLTSVTNGNPNSAFISLDGGTIHYGIQ